LHGHHLAGEEALVDNKVPSNADTFVQPAAMTFGEGEGPTFEPSADGTNGPTRIGLWAYPGRLIDRWRGLSLTAQFLTFAALIMCGAMAVLGQWLSAQIEAGQIRSRAESAGLYMHGFLAPHVRQLDDSPEISTENHLALDRLLINSELSDRVEGVRIWRADGTVIYSTEKSLIGKRMLTPDVARAFRGDIVAQLEREADDEDGIARSYPLLEVYAPIYHDKANEVIAVGEFYEEAGQFLDDLAAAQRSAWVVVGLTTAAIMALLFLIVRRASRLIIDQQGRLTTQLAMARGLARQNRTLRETADKLRISASQANERLLNRIGADLHDGPVQLLSLLILRLGQAPPRPRPSTSKAKPAADTGAEQLARQVLTELRDLSSGLILPELGHANLEQALRLAVTRHELATGTMVDVTFEGLPEQIDASLKICLFRVIQEGLNNAFRHGEAKEQTVIVQASSDAITISVADSGPGPSERSDSQIRVNPLGLQGIRNRVEVFGGSMQLRRREPRGAELFVEIPLEPSPNRG